MCMRSKLNDMFPEQDLMGICINDPNDKGSGVTNDAMKL
jgi:hypothetical protein